MSFMNQYDGIVGQSQDFPQRILNQTYGQSAPAPLAFSESSGPSKKSYKQMAEEVKSDTIADIQDEQENLSDRLDALEAKTEQKKRKTVKEFWNANHRKVKIAIAVGAALYLGYRLFLKDKINFKFGGGGQAPMPSDPMPMESGGEISSADI